MSAGQKGHEEFLAEATEILEALGRGLGGLEEAKGKRLDPELLNGIFRAAHSLKGVASMFGQEPIALLAHSAEDLLDRLRLGRAELSEEVLEALSQALDALHRRVAAVASGQQGAPSAAEKGLASRLSSLGGQDQGRRADPLDELALEPQVRAVFTEYEEHRLRENVSSGAELWRVRAAFDLEDFDEHLGRLNECLKPLGEVISTLPSAEPGAEQSIAFDLIFGSHRPAAELADALRTFPAAATPIERKVAKPSKKGRARKPAPAPQASLSLPLVLEPEPSLRSLTQTVRVDIGRLDGLMNAVGELLLVKANLQRLAETRTVSGDGKAWGQELHRELRQLDRRLDELQEGILEVRMVPLGQVFEKLARLVRKVAKEMGKELDFVVQGGEVELDKLIVEELSDPLMHLLRNAIDHGVESPRERVAAGKPRKGRVGLSAAQRGNHVVIELSDDGQGLNEDRICQTAVKKGLITSAQAAKLNARERQGLIFLPGLSTATSVSELSGRGVGLDVVKTNLANMSGLIDVASHPGQGAVFTLTLPVTLAIIRALVVAASGRTYAVPLNSVVEIVSLEAAEIKTVERKEVFSLRGQTVPFARLSQLFGLPQPARSRHFVVIVGLAQERLGIAVDSLLGQQDVVIKPLPSRLRHLPGVAGATDLGNRQTVLVIDVAGLMHEQGSEARAGNP